MKVKMGTIRVEGVVATARKLGCSKTHLSLIIRGQRDSKRLRERARQMGIRLPRIPAAV